MYITVSDCIDDHSNSPKFGSRTFWANQNWGENAMLSCTCYTSNPATAPATRIWETLAFTTSKWQAWNRSASCRACRKNQPDLQQWISFLTDSYVLWRVISSDMSMLTSEWPWQTITRHTDRGSTSVQLSCLYNGKAHGSSPKTRHEHWCAAKCNMFSVSVHGSWPFKSQNILKVPKHRMLVLCAWVDLLLSTVWHFYLFNVIKCMAWIRISFAIKWAAFGRPPRHRCWVENDSQIMSFAMRILTYGYWHMDIDLVDIDLLDIDLMDIDIMDIDIMDINIITIVDIKHLWLPLWLSKNCVHSHEMS